MTGTGVASAELDRARPSAAADSPDRSPSRSAAPFALVLTHGAGGGVDSPDLLAARAAALELGGAVARVLQPWRAAGRVSAGPVAKQDATWLEIVAALRELWPGLPLVQGGRSNGARLACRTAVAAGAVAVLALAFPLHPPGKGGDPSRSRAGELRDAGVPVLVINGDRDPFGVPDPADADRLVVLAAETHALARHPDRITPVVRDWLAAVLPGLSATGSGYAAPEPRRTVASQMESGHRRSAGPGRRGDHR